MKKKLLLTSIGSLIVIIIAIIFIHNSHKVKGQTKEPTFCVVHGSGFKFPFDIEVPVGTSYLEAVMKLGTTKSIKSIYTKSGTKWTEVDRESGIKYSCEIKVEE